MSHRSASFSINFLVGEVSACRARLALLALWKNWHITLATLPRASPRAVFADDTKWADHGPVASPKEGGIFAHNETAAAALE